MLNIMQNNLEVRGGGTFSISEILEAKTPTQTTNYLYNPSPFPFSLILNLKPAVPTDKPNTKLAKPKAVKQIHVQNY